MCLSALPLSFLLQISKQVSSLMRLLGLLLTFLPELLTFPLLEGREVSREFAVPNVNIVHSPFAPNAKE